MIYSTCCFRPTDERRLTHCLETCKVSQGSAQRKNRPKKKKSSYFSPAGGQESAAAANGTFHQVSLFPIINKEREGQPCGLHNECIWICIRFQRQKILWQVPTSNVIGRKPTNSRSWREKEPNQESLPHTVFLFYV